SGWAPPVPFPRFRPRQPLRLLCRQWISSRKMMCAGHFGRAGPFASPPAPSSPPPPGIPPPAATSSWSRGVDHPRPLFLPSLERCYPGRLQLLPRVLESRVRFRPRVGKTPEGTVMSGPGKWALFVAIGTLASGCAGSGPLRTSARDAAKAPEDPVSRLIASADARLAGGQEQSRAGHLNRAREEFDRALDLYLNAPGGAYASPRVAEAYKRTLEAIQLSEFEALAAGDGFSEDLPEPAAIDD